MYWLWVSVMQMIQQWRKDRLTDRNGPVTVGQVKNDPVTVEQGCRWRKSVCVKTGWSDHDRARKSLHFRYGHELRITFRNTCKMYEKQIGKIQIKSKHIKGQSGQTLQAISLMGWLSRRREVVRKLSEETLSENSSYQSNTKAFLRTKHDKSGK